MKIFVRISLVLLLAVFGVSSAFATDMGQRPAASLSGIITDGSTNLPMGDVTVRIDCWGKPRSMQTAGDGSYVVNDLPLGGATITVSHAGYRSQTVTIVMTTMRRYTENIALFRPNEVPTVDSAAFSDEFHEAMRLMGAHRVAKVQAMIQADPKLIFKKDSFTGWTLLHAAAMNGLGDLVELLLAHGADVNAKTEATLGSGETPLHVVAVSGRKDIAELLLAGGADVDARTDNGETPLYLAAREGRNEFAEFLLAHGADVNAKDNVGLTALHIAAYQGHQGMVRLLLAANADVNARNNGGATPLHMAALAYQGQEKAAELLLAGGADVNAKNNDGLTPLRVAVLTGHAGQSQTPYGNTMREPLWPDWAIGVAFENAIFQQMDVNHDGKISKKEWMAFYEKQFDRIDG